MSKPMNFVDVATFDGPKKTSEGYLVADAFAVRTGIQRYLGYEVGRPDLQVVDVYRPAEEVFKATSLQSFSHVPVTVDHPSVMVTADNWKDFAVGESSSDVLRDGERMKIPLILKDANAIAAVESGKRQLSAGYMCSLDWTPGETSDGKTYQVVQRDIRANHIAIVAKGRAGSEFRIGDADPATWGASPITDEGHPPMNMRNILVDGITIQTTDQGAQAIEKKDGQIAQKDAAIASLNGEKAQLTADNLSLTGQVNALKASLEDAKKVNVEALVEARTSLVADAKKILPALDAKGLNDVDIRRKALVAKMGDAKVGAMSDDVVKATFDAVISLLPGQPQMDAGRSAISASTMTMTAGGFQTSDSQAAYEARIRAGRDAK